MYSASMFYLIIYLCPIVLFAKMAYVVNKGPVSYYQCLKKLDYADEVFINLVGLPDYGIVDSKNIEQLNSIGINPHVVLAHGLTQQNSIEKTTSLYSQFFNSHQIKMVWLSNISLMNVSCEYFINFTVALANKTRNKLGIHTFQQQWSNTFGSNYACPQLQNFPLFYVLNSMSWKPFGGWVKYDLWSGNKIEACSYISDILTVQISR